MCLAVPNYPKGHAKNRVLHIDRNSLELPCDMLYDLSAKGLFLLVV